MIKHLLKYSICLIITYIFICLITPFNKALLNRSISNQINYLSQILDAGYDDQLQYRFPEGKIFSNALLALSVIQFCDKNGRSEKRYAHIVDNCIKRIRSKKAINTFDPYLKPKYGMFYKGWSNLIYSTYKKSTLFKYSNISKSVIQLSNEIVFEFQQIQDDSLQILNSYMESNWPADNLIGIASLDHDSLKINWTSLILKSAEHPSGLIHHTGSQENKIRGSSSAMITYCLSKSNYPDAASYYATFDSLLIDSYLGVQLVKENENGSNDMDIDSGPVVFGYGAAATIMNIKTQASLKQPNAKFTWALMNLIAAPINIFGKKSLILKQEPMLDLFMLWSSTEL